MKKSKLKKAYRCGTYLTIEIILFWVLLTVFTSCSTKYVPVTSVKTETKYIDRLVQNHDSIYMHDSVFSFAKGDTVFVNRLSYKYRDRYVFHTDSLNYVKIDSVRVPYPIERELTKWQKVKQETGGYVIAILSAVILIAAGRFLYKKLV